jgi:hypothetical protein
MFFCYHVQSGFCHASMEEDSVPMADIRNCCKQTTALGILEILPRYWMRIWSRPVPLFQ